MASNCSYDRSGRFLARLDAHLPTIADAGARRAFLEAQIDGWERRYARFIATDGASEPIADPADPPQAADFLLTITGLATRRDTIANQGETSIMTNNTRAEHDLFPKTGTHFSESCSNDTKQLGSAILSLLVAADQRCPAIIGQAHVLYHDRFANGPLPSTQTFAQLKRDAADLFRAIAAVEAAMQDATPTSNTAR
jgi:hypothetical protein